ncbi:MAG: glycosyltransferase family 1 protein [Bacteroidales bacterium]|nr:glycosyltransferase family 1 protein [Bacteroidales bacterium]
MSRIHLSRILIATDAWHPQVNGVVRTLDTTVTRLQASGHLVEVIEPSAFPNGAVPFYPEIRVAWVNRGQLFRRIRHFGPDAVHIATEGPIGLGVRAFCRQARWRFTTSYHTRFPEYLRKLVRLPECGPYAYLRWFHRRSAGLMVATPSLEAELSQRGFTAPKRRWSRGVDLTLFHPRPKPAIPLGPGPVLLYVGRVSKEKGIDDFLMLKTPGTKVIVGDGPYRQELERRYPAARFLGYRTGEALAETFAAADLFVFPSRTDTFGIVLIEALASGLPVAAYPVTGPIDIIHEPRLGALDADLGRAVAQALATGEPAACVAEGERYTWERCTQQFLDNLVPCRSSDSGI